MNVQFFSCPSSLAEQPSSWSYDLTVEIAVEEEKGNQINFGDNAFYRMDVEILQDHLAKVRPDKIILYGGMREYTFIRKYLDAFKGVQTVVRGFPAKVVEDLPLERGANFDAPDRLPYPAWNFVPVADYYDKSPIPHSVETLGVERRAVFKSRWVKAQSPNRVMKILRYLKLNYNFDFLTWDEDLTVDKARTLELMRLLETYELNALFTWMCKASVDNIDRDLVSSLKDHGCKVVDFGEADVTRLRDNLFKTRLEVALQTVRKWEMTPLIQITVGSPDTEKSDLVDGLKFMIANDSWLKPKISNLYPDGELWGRIRDKVEDVEAHILKLNSSFVNLTRWSDAELLGILELMDRRDLQRLENL